MNIMIDLETLGTSIDSVILSIGAVAFNDQGIKGVFERHVDIDSQPSRVVSHDTFKWWFEQSEEARKALTRGMSRACSLEYALAQLSLFFKLHGDENVKVWGNGSDFDNAILSHAYRTCGMSQPWKYHNNRCYRTVKSLLPDVKFERKGTHHRAVDDAESQALHLIKIAEVHNADGII